MERILPRPTPASQPYFDGCAEGELRLQYCVACEQHQFYPRTFCAGCGSQNIDWRAVSGLARVASYSIVRRGVSKAYPAPYVIALVDLDEGPRMMTTIIGAELERVCVGMRVEVEFEAWSDEIYMPVFKPVQES